MMKENESKSVIELTELRIGNYLLYKGEIVYVTSLSLDIDDEYEDTIGFCKLGSASNEIAGWNRALYNDLSRIEITSEWLEKLGFQKTDKSPYRDSEAYVIFSDERRLIWCEGNIFKPLIEGFIRITSHDFLRNPRPVKHVHDLQNAVYVLSGEELKMEVQ